MTPALEGTPIPDGWVPAFPGQRPPFAPGNEWTAKPGNTLAQRHGAYSPRKVDPLAEEIAEGLLSNASAPWLQEPSNRLAVWALARAEARVQLLDEWVGGMDIVDAAQSDRGQTSPLELLRRFEATAAAMRANLGLDPIHRARLGRDVAATQVDLSTLLARQTERIEREATDGR